jgi:hypothetical protein
MAQGGKQWAEARKGLKNILPIHPYMKISLA